MGSRAQAQRRRERLRQIRSARRRRDSQWPHPAREALPLPLARRLTCFDNYSSSPSHRGPHRQPPRIHRQQGHHLQFLQAISFGDVLPVAYMSPEQTRADLNTRGTGSRSEKFWRYPGSRSVNAVLLTAPVAGCVADGVEVILGAQDQAIPYEGWRGQRHFAEVVGAEQFVFIAGADHERPAFFVHTKDLAIVAPGR